MQLNRKEARCWYVEVKPPDHHKFMWTYDFIAKNFREVEEMLFGQGVDISRVVSVDSCDLSFEDNFELFREDWWLNYVSYRLAKEEPNVTLPG